MTIRSLTLNCVFGVASVAAVATVVVGPAVAQQQIVVGTAKPQATSGPICGGVVNGKPQNACGAKPATYESAALGACPAGSFPDLLRGECWSCPAGLSRTLGTAVDSDRACNVPDRTVRGEFTSAQYRGPFCPPGTFYDSIRGGECWSCPSGYRIAVLPHVEAFNKCIIPAHEEFRPINKHNKATGWIIKTDCPRGQFWDPIDGFCYSCPGGFYRRGEYSVRDGRACSRSVGEQQARATNRGTAQCEAGERHDLKIPGQPNLSQVDVSSGGGCWKCPTAYDFTVFPIDGPSACERGGGIRFAKAKFVTALSCPAGQHFYSIGVSASELAQLNAKKLAKPGAKSADSGTCWSCPSGFKRSGASVKSAQACSGKGFEWYTAPYPEPGLFGIAGAEGVVVELLRKDNAKAFEVAIEEIAKQTNTKLEDARREFWDEIRTEPENSPILKAVAQAALLAAIEEPEQVTAAQRTLAIGFAPYYRDRKTYVAKDALAAYDAWKVADDYWRARRGEEGKEGLLTLFDTGIVPPDFREIVGAGVYVGLATGAGLGAAFTGVMAIPAVYKAVFPFARRTAKRAIDKAGIKAGAKIGIELGEKATMKAAEQGAKAAAKSIQKLAGALKALSSIGPQIIITIATEIVIAEFEKAIAIAEARPKLLTAVATAQRQPDFRRLIDSDQGYGEITGYWSLAVSGGSKPSPIIAKTIAEIAAAKLGGSAAAAKADAGWESLPGIATAIGVGANGSVWHIGNNKVPGGFGIYRWDKTRWTNVPGGAVRIAVDPKGNPWVVNDQNKIFRYDGRKWIGIRDVAKDIGATDIGIGANGSVWVLGTNKVPGGFGVFRWDNDKWTSVPGGAVRIAVDPKGNPWVANDQKKIFRHDGKRWRDVPGHAIDIGVGANGLVWYVGTNKVAGGFDIYAWDGKGWQGVPGGLMQIAVAPDGRPFGVNDAGHIFWKK